MMMSLRWPKTSGGALDTALLQMLKDLRKKIAKQKGFTAVRDLPGSFIRGNVLRIIL